MNGQSYFDTPQSIRAEEAYLLKNLQNNLASTISQLDSRTQAKLGFNASTSPDIISKQINERLKKRCGPIGPTDSPDSPTNICRIDNIGEIIDDTYEEANSKSIQQSYYDAPIEPLSKSTNNNWWYLAIAVAIIVLVIGIIGFSSYYYQTESSVGQLVGSKQLAFYFVIIVVLIIFAFFTRGEKKKEIKPRDLRKWQRKLKNIQRIAHIAPPSQQPSPELSPIPSSDLSSIPNSDNINQYY